MIENEGDEMSETKYPLCARAGLKIVEFTSLWAHSQGELVPNSESAFVSAAVVEKLLAGATTVWLKENKHGSTRDYVPYQLTANPGLQSHYTHTARLVMIEPIKPKSLEDKILEVLDDHSRSATEALTAIRRLLEGK